MHEERRAATLAGIDRTPKNTRPSIVSLNKLVWELLPHDRLAAKVYLQTGPGLPMEGPEELGKVLKEIDPGERAGEYGTTIRDEAIRFVQEG